MEGAGINELAGKLELASISENGEKVLLFFACARFITEICCFLSTAFSINKELSEHVTSFLAKCSHLSRLERRYKNGIPLSRIPDILYHTVTLLHYQYLMLAGRMMKRGGAALDEESRSSLFMTGIRVVAELRPGYEYHQFNLITGLLFDGHVNPTCWNCGAHFLKSYEAIVSRDSIAKSQEFWTETRKSPSQFVGKLVSGTNVKVSWIFLTDDMVTSLPEQTLFEYLMFLHHLLIDCKIGSVPVCVQLIHVMKIFMLPSQPFLQSRLSQYLDKFLTYFSSLSFIDFKQSTLSGYPSFYDFFNLFCGSYEAEGFCDPVFAGFVLLPTRCDYALTYRRLLWVERIETLRMLRTSSLSVHKTLPAPESDADLMCIYMSALKNGITGIPKLIAMHHVVRFFTDDRITKDDKLLAVMLKHVALCSDQTKEELLKFDKVNEHNEIVFHEKMVDGRKQKFGIN